MCSLTSSITEIVGFGINVLTIKETSFELKIFPLQEVVLDIVDNCSDSYLTAILQNILDFKV